MQMKMHILPKSCVHLLMFKVTGRSVGHMAVIGQHCCVPNWLIFVSLMLARETFLNNVPKVPLFCIA